jgi:hypothetical protein
VPRHLDSSARRRAASVVRGSRVAAVLLGVVVLAGCTGPAPAPSGPSTSASPPPEPTAGATDPAEPVLVVGGSANDNLPLFAAVTSAVWNSPEGPSGRAYIDALVAAGFDKASMQVTEDLSTVGNRAESIQFSVRWGDECLIGQVGQATGDPVTVVEPVLAEGTCLIGQTRPIDW